jgi:hypothetical protein
MSFFFYDIMNSTRWFDTRFLERGLAFGSIGIASTYVREGGGCYGREGSCGGHRIGGFSGEDPRNAEWWIENLATCWKLVIIPSLLVFVYHFAFCPISLFYLYFMALGRVRLFSSLLFFSLLAVYILLFCSTSCTRTLIFYYFFFFFFFLLLVLLQS